MTPPGSWARVVVAVLLGGSACAAPADGAPSPATVVGTTTPSSATSQAPADGVTPAAPVRTAASQRRTFAPQRIRLLSDRGVAARVVEVDADPDGTLDLPADPGVAGWWVGGALAGEVFGSVVLAGHIDSRSKGVGYFAALLDAEPGDRVELSGHGLRQVYVVRSNREVAKDALSTRTDLLDRAVAGRLILITCTGTFDPRTRHYDHNLVVTADPVGEPVAST